MTRSANARLAGVSFLAYIVLGILSMVRMGVAIAGTTTVERLANIARHTADIRLSAILTLLTSFCAIVLGVTLWAVTRDEDPDIAMLGFACRLCEGLLGILAVQRTLELLWFATSDSAKALSSDALNALATYVFKSPGGETASILFAVGSLCFSWLLLRGRMIPAWLAWIGVVASASWVIGMPLQLVGVLPSAATYPMWILMALFEVPFALWLIVKGVAAPVRTRGV